MRRKKLRDKKEKRSQKKNDAGARKGRKVAKCCVFPTLATAAGAEPSGQLKDEKLHAIVAKQISKSKCETHLMFGALLEVEMFEKCTRLWRKAHVQVKLAKTQRVRSTFGS